MNMHKHDEAGPPCSHMEPLLHRAADGSANWLTRAYAVAHAARCVRCGAFLHNLEIGLAKLREAKAQDVPDDALLRIRERMAAEAERAGRS